MTKPPVHNHGPAEGLGLYCPERRTTVGNYLRGACMPDPVPTPEPYCDHGPFDACRCLAADADLMAAAQRAYQEQREADATHDA